MVEEDPSLALEEAGPLASEPAHSPVACFLSGLTSLRALQALRPGPGLRLPVPGEGC